MDSVNFYKSVCEKCSEVITKNYSTSFSLGIRMFSKKFRQPIYSIYGFVRFADEIVDSFFDQDQSALLEKLRLEMREAIALKYSINPVLHSFQSVVHKYNIDIDLIDAFLDSMAMDLTMKTHNKESYENYIYGSAEVIGLMCLKVFLENDETEYQRLKPYAQSLGAAFQKVNFLRDIKSDYRERGRVYFPHVVIHDFNNKAKKQIENEIKSDFEHAYVGLTQLPKGVKFGVYTAYIYYLKLFEKIINTDNNDMLSKRIRIPNSHKFYLLTKSALKNQLNYL